MNDEEEGLKADLFEWLERARAGAARTTAITGPARTTPTRTSSARSIHHQVILPITAGRLDLGPWEQVFYAEFDGQRKKRVVVKVLGE